MTKYTFKAFFGDHDKTVEVGHVYGSGGNVCFHVYQDRYYIAKIFLTPSGWQWHTPEKANLQIDDLQVLIEIIERKLLEGDSSDQP